MIQGVRAWLLLLLCLLAFAVPSRAYEPSALSADPGRFFDGAGPAAADNALLNFKAVRPVEAADVRSTSGRHAQQSGADLYYFSPQEAEEAAQRILVHGLFPKKKGFSFDPDVPADIQTQMLNDLKFIQGIAGRGATPLHRQIFGAVDGTAYFGFFDERVTGIGMDDCGSANAVACVIPFANPSKMWLTQNFIRFSHPQIARLMVVFHEARHTEIKKRFWSHATCPTPFRDAKGNDIKSIWTGAMLAGEPACDKTPFGSYGSSTVMLKNIQKFCANCTDKVKMDAGLYADDQFGRITDADARKQMEQDLYNR